MRPFTLMKRPTFPSLLASRMWMSSAVLALFNSLGLFFCMLLPLMPWPAAPSALLVVFTTVCSWTGDGSPDASAGGTLVDELSIKWAWTKQLRFGYNLIYLIFFSIIPSQLIVNKLNKLKYVKAGFWLSLAPAGLCRPLASEWLGHVGRKWPPVCHLVPATQWWPPPRHLTGRLSC